MNNTVIVRACEEYDPEQIEAIVADGMERLGYRPAGKVFAKPNVVVAYHIDKCFTTVTDMIMKVSHRMGMPSPFRDPGFLFPFAKAALAASLRKCISLRYLQDFVYFLERGLLRKI